jgi:hypothetical protein
MAKINQNVYQNAQALIGKGAVDVFAPWQPPDDPNAVTGFLGDDDGTPCCPVGMNGKVYASALSAYCAAVPYDDPCAQLASKLMAQIRAITFTEEKEQSPSFDVEFGESAAKPLEIFRAGTHTASDGTRYTFSEADVAACAEAYSPALHEAPIVVGHPKENAPAYGWVASLGVTKGVLKAVPQQVDPQFAEMVSKGRFKKISASFYSPDHSANPKPGVWYLRHVGFLGAQPPAVKGLKDAAFAEGEGPEFIRIWDFKEYTDKERSKMADAGTAMDDGSYPIKTKEDLANAIQSYGRASDKAAVKAWITKRAKALNATDMLPADWPGSTKKEADMAEAEIEKLREELEAAKKRAAELEFSERLHKAEKFIEGLMKPEVAKVTPAMAAKGLAAFMATLDDVAVVTFAEASKDDKGNEIPAVKATQAAQFREILNALPKAVEFTEAAPREKPAKGGKGTDIGNAEPDPERAALDLKVHEFMEKDASLTYEQALDKALAATA